MPSSAVGGLIVQPSEQIPQEALPGENAPFEGQSDPEVDALADEMGITLKDVAKGGVSAETNRANKARMR